MARGTSDRDDDATRGDELKRRIYLVLLPVVGAAALVVGVTGSLDAVRATANWRVALAAGVVLFTAMGIVAWRRRVPAWLERAVAMLVLGGFLYSVAVTAVSSLGGPGDHALEIVRAGIWTAAISGFAHLAMDARSARVMSWIAWAALAAATGTILVAAEWATTPFRTTMIESLLVQGAALVIIAGIVRITRAERAHATSMAVMARRDPLTGLWNRRGAEDRLEEEVDRARRYGSPLAVAWLDLDHFKRINDTYGHDVGDRVLRAVGDVVGREVRKHDTAARWGGEEFLVVLPGQSDASARDAADRLRRAIAALDVGLPGGENVTTSLGVARLGPSESAAELVRRADQALYAAKAAGRDRVVVADAAAPDGVGA